MFCCCYLQWVLMDAFSFSSGLRLPLWRGCNFLANIFHPMGGLLYRLRVSALKSISHLKAIFWQLNLRTLVLVTCCHVHNWIVATKSSHLLGKKKPLVREDIFWRTTKSTSTKSLPLLLYVLWRHSFVPSTKGHLSNVATISWQIAWPYQRGLLYASERAGPLSCTFVCQVWAPIPWNYLNFNSSLNFSEF